MFEFASKRPPVIDRRERFVPGLAFVVLEVQCRGFLVVGAEVSAVLVGCDPEVEVVVSQVRFVEPVANGEMSTDRTAFEREGVGEER